MDIIIYIFLLFLSFFVTFLKLNSFLKINTIYTFIWSMVGLLSKLDFLKIVKPSMQIHMFIWISIIVFNVIYLFLCVGNKEKGVPVLKYKVNYSYIYILNLIACLIISPLFFQACIGIMQNGFSNYRGSIFELANGSDISIFFNRVVVGAIFDATAVIAAAEIIQGRKKLLKWAIVGIILYTITYGGRYSIMNFIAYYMAAYLLLQRYKTFRIQFKRKYLILGVVALILVTIGRGTGEAGILGMVLLYFVGSLSYLQVILDHPVHYGLLDYTYGAMTFAFIVEPIALLLKFLFHLNIDTPSYHFNIYMQPFSNIGAYPNVVMYNNNSTFLYNFLRDFGVIGIVIGTAFISGVCAILENSSKKGDNRSVLLLIFIFGVIISSTMKYSLLTSKATIIILIILWVTRKQKDEKTGKRV
ncbi:O-antigen polymerase [Priestia flexa]|uniref:O-antigen polymerase n=1 Tax=Priestia flexa TaxID=86664 RepID=UPI0039B6D34D